MSLVPTYPPMLADYGYDASPSPYLYEDYFNFNAYPQMEFPFPVYSEPVAFWRSLDFPAEIIYMIIEAADDDPDLPTYDSAIDLYRFLYVSRKWRSQAERYIYTYVHVPEGEILLFWRTILARSDLATYVRELHLGDGVIKDVDEGDVDMIVNGLMMLHNLRDLSLWCNKGMRSSSLNKILPATSSFILRNPFPFKLFRLCTDLIWSEDLRDFLVAQPEIRILYLSVAHNYETSYELPPTALPNLRCFYACPGILKDFARVPPITHAHVLFLNHDASQEALGASEVCKLGSSLRVLAFTRRNNPLHFPDMALLTPSALLRSVAAACTRLTILCIYDCWQIWSPRDHDAVLRVVTGNFPQLRLFIWGSLHKPGATKDWDIEEYEGFNTEPDDDDDALEKIQLFAWELFTKHHTGTLEFVITSGFSRTPPATVFVKDPEGGLPFMEEEPCDAREDMRSFEFHDPDAPMDYIDGAYSNPDRFDRSVGWKPEYTHFLRHTILYPTASPADYGDPTIYTCPPQPRTWARVETAHYHSDNEEISWYE